MCVHPAPSTQQPIRLAACSAHWAALHTRPSLSRALLPRPPDRSFIGLSFGLLPGQGVPRLGIYLLAARPGGEWLARRQASRAQTDRQTDTASLNAKHIGLGPGGPVCRPPACSAMLSAVGDWDFPANLDLERRGWTHCAQAYCPPCATPSI